MLAFGNATKEISLETTNEKRMNNLGVTVFFTLAPH
jgi:hypothetical protein